MFYVQLTLIALALVAASGLFICLYLVLRPAVPMQQRTTEDRRAHEPTHYYLVVVNRHGRERCRFPGTRQGQHLLRQWMVWHAALGDSVETRTCERTVQRRVRRTARPTVDKRMLEAERIHAQYLASLQDYS